MFHFFTLIGINSIQSGCILPRCMEYTAFNLNAWNPLHSIWMLWAMLKKSTAINQDALGLAAWTPLHTIGIHCAKMHGIDCI